MALEFSSIPLDTFVKENKDQLRVETTHSQKMKLANLMFAMIDAFYQSDAEYHKLMDIIVRLQKTSDSQYTQDEIDLVIMQEKFLLIEIGKIAIDAYNVLDELGGNSTEAYSDHLELEETKMHNNAEKFAKIVRGHMTYTREFLFQDKPLDDFKAEFQQFALIMLNYCGYMIEDINRFNESHRIDKEFSAGGILQVVLERFFY